MVSAFCKMRENKRGAFGRRRKPKPAKTENRFCSEFSLKTHGKPGPQIFLRTHPKKNCGIIAYYGIKHGF